MNGIKKVKFFDVVYDVIRVLVGIDIEVMVVVLNNLFVMFVGDLKVVEDWVKVNVIFYNFKGGVNIRYDLLWYFEFLF